MLKSRLAPYINTIIVAIGAFAVGLIISAFVANANQPIGGLGNDDGSYGGEFTLQHVKGDVALTDFEGQLVVLYFGFLGCSNYCDTSMAVLKSTFNQLGEKAEGIQALLVSIDPYRDDLNELEQYAKQWHPQIMGLGGSEQQIAAVTRQYGAYYERTADEEGDVDDYEYLHTSRFFIINREGQLVDAMRHSTTPNELAARLSRFIES